MSHLTSNCSSSGGYWEPYLLETPWSEYDLPYFTHFENEVSGKVPDCWTFIMPNNTPPTVNSNTNISGSKNLRFNGYESKIATPALKMDINSVKMSFILRREGDSS